MGFFSKILKREKTEAAPKSPVVLPPEIKREIKISKDAKPFSDFGILREPHITEKTVNKSGAGFFTFKVSSQANKIAVRDAAEKKFGVKVVSVRLMNVPGKVRRLGQREGFAPGFRKAVVKLAKGQTIEFGT